MTYIDLIDQRTRRDRRFEASLHGMTLEGDEVKAGTAHNRSHDALLRMKARRARDHG